MNDVTAMLRYVDDCGADHNDDVNDPIRRDVTITAIIITIMKAM